MHKTVLLTRDTNITEPPSNIVIDPNITSITLGDIHGNTMLLIHALMFVGILTPRTKGLYHKLYSIYQINDNPKTTKQFSRLLKQFDVNNSVKIRLLGDDLSDRGSNDFYTLELYSMLLSNGVDLSVVLSNHNLEFIMYCESLINVDWYAPTLSRECRVSLSPVINMVTSDKTKTLTSIKKIKSYLNMYIKLIKVIDYIHSDDSISIFTHAPVDLQFVKKLAKDRGVEYHDSNITELAQTIDSINTSIHTDLANFNMTQSTMYDGTTSTIHFLWNRYYSILQRDKVYNKYNISYIHGHDSAVEYLDGDNLITLDGALGKYLGLESGKLRILLEFRR